MNMLRWERFLAETLGSKYHVPKYLREQAEFEGERSPACAMSDNKKLLKDDKKG